MKNELNVVSMLYDTTQTNVLIIYLWYKKMLISFYATQNLISNAI